MNITIKKLTEPTPEIAKAFSKWENDPFLIPFIRPNRTKEDLDIHEIVTSESLKERLEHDVISVNHES